MPGRRLLPEPHFAGGRYASAVHARRRAVLRGTLASFDSEGGRLRARAAANLQRWRQSAKPQAGRSILVLPGDWGEVAGALTRSWGTIFAVLNMANAHRPGGAYVEGTAAQEENMFRRTDCHYSVLDEHLDQERYTSEMTDLLEAKDGRVYLDVENPRTCLRGPEEPGRDDLGYRWLTDDEIFPFHELRAAAQNLRGGRPFDESDARQRIEAQLDTLVAAGLRHAVLSAFGCGAFANPADRVAMIYRETLAARNDDFDCVAFAIFHPGYGPDNHPVFHRILLDEDPVDRGGYGGSLT